MVHFLDLPLEIREQIYTYLLANRLPDSRTPSWPDVDYPPMTLHPAILAVSHQTHQEALPILYSQNTFRAHPTLLASFPSLYHPSPTTSSQLPQLSESTCPGVRLIRRWYLRVRLDCGPFWDAEAVERSFTGAEEVTLQLWQSMFLECGNEVLRGFEGVRGVRRVRIWGSTSGMEGYLRWLEGAMRSPVGTYVAPFVDGDGEEELKAGWSGPVP